MSERQDAVVLIGASYVRGWDIKEIADIPVINKGVGRGTDLRMLGPF
jgi:hypothetical protein